MSPRSDSKRTVGSSSEGAILKEILRRTPDASAAVIGPGDDAAVLRLSGDVVLTTDTLVHGPDFRLAWTNGRNLGYKAAAVNLADIAAMGATPTALLVALIAPAETEVDFVAELADGLREACEIMAPGCAVVGGDLTTGDTLTVAVTAVGDMQGRDPITRSGAGIGDQLALSGHMGRADEGLSILFTSFRRDGVPINWDTDDLSDHDRKAIDAQLRPVPPVRDGVLAAESGATAMLDVSDGLVLDASRMARASAVTIDIDSRAIGDDIQRALAGGEDHALLATFPADAPLPGGFRRIGTVTRRVGADVLVDGELYDGRTGWDPFADWDSQGG